MEAQRRPLYLAAADAVIPNKTTPAGCRDGGNGGAG